MQVLGLGKITFAVDVKIGVPISPNYFSGYSYIEAREKTSTIFIDSGTWINNNFSAIAEHTSIKIGKNCLIGFNVTIIDSDFHGLKISERLKSHPEKAREVTISDNVFIGSHVNIMKGVKIGAGSVIASGSVVTKDVPESVIAGGNPAIIIRKIEE
jgi:maltose O-acetyltransferase